MNEEEARLISEAEEIAQKYAHILWSGIKVGAVVLLSNGRKYGGANIESYIGGLGICAERVAIAHALMNVPTEKRDKIKIKGISISFVDTRCPPELKESPPCGACLQWIADLAPKAWIIWKGDKETKKHYLDELLKHPFKP